MDEQRRQFFIAANIQPESAGAMDHADQSAGFEQQLPGGDVELHECERILPADISVKSKTAGNSASRSLENFHPDLLPTPSDGQQQSRAAQNAQ